MLLNRKLLTFTLITFLASFLADCQEKKKNNNALALGAVALAIANTEYKVSGQVTLFKSLKKRKPSTDTNAYDQDTDETFYESIPNAILKIEGGQEITADDSGFFTFPALKNGAYKITITRKQDTTRFPSITSSTSYDCTGVADVNVGGAPFFLITNCLTPVTLPQDSIAPQSGDYQIGSFTLVVNGETAQAQTEVAGTDVLTSGARYNVLYFQTNPRGYIVYDKATSPSLSVRFLTSETIRVVSLDARCDRTKKDCLQSLMYGKWLMQGSQQIPPNLLGLSEVTFNTSALCYHATRFIARKAQGTDAVLSVENKMGTPGGSYCNNDQPSTDSFGAPTVSTSVSITPVSADCFDINISYNLVRQEGRGKFSADANTLELELYNGGLNPSDHRCSAGAVGSTNSKPGFPSNTTLATIGASNPSGRPASAVQKYTRQ